MATNNGTNVQGLDDLLSEISDEIDAEQRAAMSPADQRIDDVSREILRLLRDMTVPGSPSSESVRLDRLMRFIEEREF